MPARRAHRRSPRPPAPRSCPCKYFDGRDKLKCCIAKFEDGKKDKSCRRYVKKYGRKYGY